MKINFPETMRFELTKTYTIYDTPEPPKDNAYVMLTPSMSKVVLHPDADMMVPVSGSCVFFALYDYDELLRYCNTPCSEFTTKEE